MRKPGMLQSTGSQRIGHDLVTETATQRFHLVSHFRSTFFFILVFVNRYVSPPHPWQQTRTIRNVETQDSLSSFSQRLSGKSKLELKAEVSVFK